MNKTQALFSAVVIGAITQVQFAHAQAVKAPRGDDPGSSAAFNQLYDMGHQTVFTGKVVGKSVVKQANGAPNTMAILVKTKTGNIQIQLGPQWFVPNQTAKIGVGDSVRVIGSNVTVNGYHEVMAKQVVNLKNKSVLALRDLGGAPYWVAARRGVPDRVADNALNGTVLSTNTYNYNGVPYTGYLLDTPNGNVNVLTAPTWYMANQEYSIPVGQNLQVITGPAVPVGLGNGVVLANSVISGGSTMVFQNNGVPVWYGYNGAGYQNGPGFGPLGGGH